MFYSATFDFDLSGRQEGVTARLLAATFLAAAGLAACGTSDSVDVAGAPCAAPPALTAPAAQWVNGVNTAGWAFHRTLPDNAVSSPYSIGSTMSLARAGASADTPAVMDVIWGFPQAPDRDGAASEVIRSIAAADCETTRFRASNRLYVEQAFDPRAAFVDTATSSYLADVESFDSSEPSRTAESVNDWIQEQTEGLIPEMLQPSAITPDSVLLAVNTVYLDADWRHPFDPVLTRPDTFHTRTGSVTTDFMHPDGLPSLSYVSEAWGEAIELPYESGDLAMWIVLPSPASSVDTLEGALATGAAAPWVDPPPATTSVELAIPKWEARLDTTSLLGWACPLGLCQRAPFEGIGPLVELGDVLHGAKIVVDEAGTEAAAATVAEFRAVSAPIGDVVFRADRPFAYAIVHRPSGAILFVGRVVDPTLPGD